MAHLLPCKCLHSIRFEAEQVAVFVLHSYSAITILIHIWSCAHLALSNVETKHYFTNNHKDGILFFAHKALISCRYQEIKYTIIPCWYRTPVILNYSHYRATFASDARHIRVHFYIQYGLGLPFHLPNLAKSFMFNTT